MANKKLIGRSWDVSDEHFDSKELQMGINIEKEHTDDEELCKVIAKDHLQEYPDYYSRLIKMEQDAHKEYNRQNEQKLMEQYLKEEVDLENLYFKVSSYINKFSKSIKDRALEIINNFNKPIEVESVYDPSGIGSFLDKDLESIKNNLKLDYSDLNETHSLKDSATEMYFALCKKGMPKTIAYRYARLYYIGFFIKRWTGMSVSKEDTEKEIASAINDPYYGIKLMAYVFLKGVLTSMTLNVGFAFKDIVAKSLTKGSPASEKKPILYMTFFIMLLDSLSASIVLKNNIAKKQKNL